MQDSVIQKPNYQSSIRRIAAQIAQLWNPMISVFSFIIFLPNVMDRRNSWKNSPWCWLVLVSDTDHHLLWSILFFFSIALLILSCNHFSNDVGQEPEFSNPLIFLVRFLEFRRELMRVIIHVNFQLLSIIHCIQFWLPVLWNAF